MSRTDLIADAFTMVRNAIQVRKDEVVIPYSRPLIRIMDIMKEAGYIENMKEMDNPNYKTIKVYLKYEKRKSAISGLKKVSRPGRRYYVARDKLPRVFRGYGLAIVSTSKGIVTDSEARKLGIGGEVIGYVW